MAALRHPQVLAATGLLALVATTACGGESGEAKPQMAASSPEAAPAAAGPDLERYVVLGENPKWRPIAPLFAAYAKRDIAALSDPVLNNLVLFVQKPVIETRREMLADGTILNAAVEDLTAGTDPLRKQALDRYQLIMLLTGIPQPKAVILDPSGDRHELVRGDALGSEGGRIKAILQYKMLVSVPGKKEAVEVSIAPPLVDLGTLEGGEEREL